MKLNLNRPPLKFYSAFIFLFASGCITGSSLVDQKFGAAEVIRLVASVPEETDLAVPGVASAKDVWVDMITRATTSIDVAQMYVQSKGGPDLEPVLVALEKAAKRGVLIRMLFSEQMIKSDVGALARLKAMPNTQVRTIDLRALNQGGIMHAKYWVLDGSEVYVGSQNLDWSSLSQIHETGVWVRNAALALQLDQIFNVDWNAAGKSELPASLPFADTNTNSQVELVASPSLMNPIGIPYSLDVLRGLIKSSKKSLKISLMDYSTFEGPLGAQKENTWKKIDTELRSAAARGVKIKMAVSHWNQDKPEITSIQDLSKVPGIEIKIVTIPVRSTGFIPYARVLHSKFMVVDDTVLWVGTSNWSQDYFEKSRDVELVIRREDFAQKVAQMHAKLWNEPYAVPVKSAFAYPLPRKE